MKYEYVTTIQYLNDPKTPFIKIEPPEGNGWSLLSVVTSPNGFALYYTWAKQKPFVEFNSSDSAFEQACNMIKDDDNKL